VRAAGDNRGGRPCPSFKIRKTVLLLEETSHDFGPRLNVPSRRAACLALVANSYTGGYHADIQPAMEDVSRWA
jgi:Amino acid synthesis